MSDQDKIYNSGFCDGIQVALEKFDSMIKIFNGYPSNKLTALDVKEFIEVEMEHLRGTIKINKP